MSLGCHHELLANSTGNFFRHLCRRYSWPFGHHGSLNIDFFNFSWDVKLRTFSHWWRLHGGGLRWLHVIRDIVDIQAHLRPSATALPMAIVRKNGLVWGKLAYLQLCRLSGFFVGIIVLGDAAPK